MQINNVVIAGRLTKEVTYGATKDGVPAARFILANTRRKHTNYIPITAFSGNADYAKYLHKGQRVTVVGTLNHAESKQKDGYKDYWNVNAQSFDAIHPKPHQSKSVRDLYSKYDDLSKKIDAASDNTKRHTKKTAAHHK